ncbi:hypothetical protein FACS189472_11100 [Alphaproteobacteria bacterium]|nr:hypothetical protein FACS189472_11100 [Alphaproteobacteria bacterium]
MALNHTFRKAMAMEAVGSVENALMSFTGKPTTIDQEGLFRIKCVDSHSQKPVPRGTEIEIPLTDVNLDITQMDKSYVQIDVDIDLDLVSGFDGDNKLPLSGSLSEAEVILYKRIFIFVGYKHATDAICTIKLLHNGRDVGGSEQTKAILESFLYHRVKPECELQSRAGTYSLFEDVEKMDVSKCGVYISLWELVEAFSTGMRQLGIHFPLIFLLMQI